MAEIAFSNVRKSYGPTEVIHGVEAEIADGELIVIVGPSGCGKSTFMKLTTGLKMPSRGRITIGGEPVTGPLKISGMALTQRGEYRLVSREGNRAVVALEARCLAEPQLFDLPGMPSGAPGMGGGARPALGEESDRCRVSGPLLTSARAEYCTLATH